MEVISDNYLDKTERTVEVIMYPREPAFCSITIYAGGTNVAYIKIRFNFNSKLDGIFFDQLRSAIEQVGKFLRP